MENFSTKGQVYLGRAGVGSLLGPGPFPSWPLTCPTHSRSSGVGISIPGFLLHLQGGLGPWRPEPAWDVGAHVVYLVRVLSTATRPIRVGPVGQDLSRHCPRHSDSSRLFFCSPGQEEDRHLSPNSIPGTGSPLRPHPQRSSEA